VASGNAAFSADQLARLTQSVQAAEARTGILFTVRVGAVAGDAKRDAERILANLVDSPRQPAVLMLVSPGQRFVHVMTTSGARRRISDNAAGLAVLAMTSSFGVGDLVGGIINGLRQLADAAGSPGAGARPKTDAVTTAWRS
jgi:hypothetical protein